MLVYRLRKGLRRSFAAMLALTVIIVVAVNLLLPRSLPDEPLARLAKLRAAGLPDQAALVFEQLLEIRPLDLDLNHFYLVNHAGIPPAARHDDRVVERYRGLTGAPRSAGIGYYGLGRIAALRGDYPAALDHYALVPDRSQRYLHNATGAVYRAVGHPEQAEQHFLAEVEIGGNVPEAVAGLTALYRERSSIEGMLALLTDPRTAPFVDSGARRFVALSTGDVFTYVALTFFLPVLAIGSAGWLSALAICAMYFAYFRRVDAFRQEPIGWLYGTLVLGALSALLSLVLSDILGRFDTAAPFRGLVDPNLVYSIVNVGLVEEVVKLLPLVLVVLVARQVDEPIDFMVYGGMSALGFATLENALYFTSFGLSIVFPRFLISTVMHLGMTGIIAFSWGQARCLRRGNELTAVLGGPLLAAVVHGLFNYFILVPLAGLSALSVIILLLLSGAYAGMIRLSLGQSPYFSNSREAQQRLTNYNLLFFTALLLILVTYLYNNFTYSTAIANRQLLAMGQSTLLTMALIFGVLGEFDLVSARLLALRLRGGWRP